MNLSARNLLLCFSLFALIGVQGCGTVSSLFGSKVDYQKSGKAPPLEVPPDLTQPALDDRYSVPDAKAPAGTATFSDYTRERGADAGSLATARSPLLPTPDKARVERSGAQRWLIVKAPPEQVWPVVRQYWTDAGYEIKSESSTTGVMETEWLEGRAAMMKESGIRGVLQRALGTIYSTSSRDKFRTRLERAADGSTEVYVSHRGMEEIFESEGKDRTVWQPRPSDPGMEAEVLQQLLVKFGTDEEKAKTLVADQDTAVRARLITGGESGSQLVIADPFDRAWRRVGLALDRVGFTVEDRDRSKGTYFVRYIDPQADGGKEDKGLLSKLMFWKSDAKVADNRAQYRIRVTENGDESRVEVANPAGAIEKSQTASRILALLFDQLK